MLTIKKILIIWMLLFMLIGGLATSGASASGSGASSSEQSFRQIKLYIDNDRYNKALIELNKLQKTQSSNPKFHIYMSYLQLKKGQLNDAEITAKNAIKLSYNNSEAFIKLGDIYIEKFISAENTPENQESRKKYLTKAFDNYFIAYKYNSASPFAHIGLATAYYINSQSALASDEMLKAKELSVGKAEAIYSMGEYYYKTKDYEKAKNYLEKSLNLGLTSKYKTYYLLGTIYEQEGMIEKAQKSYLQSLKIHPDHLSSQQNLDRLIKVSYNEVETVAKTPKTTADMFNDLNEELNLVMQADYHLAMDEFSEAHDKYIKILRKTPDNINAITGLAELYYAKWAEGFTNSADFVNDSKYILKARENSRNIIPLTKFKLINETGMPETVRQKFINLSISETFDFYDLLNEVRAEFLLGNYEESHNKLKKLLDFNLSNYEKFKVFKSLCYDHNYDEALILLKELKKTYYHNEELEPITQRLNSKIAIIEEKLKQAENLFNQKNEKQNNYYGSQEIIRQAIVYFPTNKKAYLEYAYLFEKQKKYKEAIEKAHTCYRLMKLYPDSNFELKEADIKKYIQGLNQKLAGAGKK